MGNRKGTTQHRDRPGLAFVDLLIEFLLMSVRRPVGAVYTFVLCLAQERQFAVRLVERATGGEA